MTRGIKRDAQVPDDVRRIGSCVSKNDLLEVAFEMAGLITGESENDNKSSYELQRQLNRIFESRGVKKIDIVNEAKECCKED